MIKLIEKLITLFGWENHIKAENIAKSEQDLPSHSSESVSKEKNPYNKQFQKLLEFRNFLINKYEIIKQKENALIEKETIYKKKIEKLREYDNKVKVIINNYRQEISQLKKMIEKSEIEISRLNQINKQYTDEINSLSEEIHQPENEIYLDIKRDLENRKMLFKTLYDDYNKKIKEIFNLTQREDELIQKVKCLEKEINRLKKQYENDEIIPVVETNIELVEENIQTDQSVLIDNTNHSINNNTIDDSVVENIDYGIEPIHRGGHRGNKNLHSKNDDQVIINKNNDCLKYNLICWKKEWKWFLGIKLAEGFEIEKDARLFQNNIELTPEGSRENSYCLINVIDDISVNNSQSQDLLKSFNYPEILIFKLLSGNKSEGIKVKQINSGDYLIIVPDNWVYNQEIETGSKPIIEEVLQTGLKAYYFYIEENTPKDLYFIDNNRDEKFVNNSGDFIELIGNKLENNFEKQGLLFGEKLPALKIKNQAARSRIQKIVIGEEGADKTGWQNQINLFDGTSIIQLADIFNEILSGWYFLRLYDDKDILIDSLDFRYISSVNKINYINSCFTPGNDGHSMITIEIFHTNAFYFPEQSGHYPNIKIDNTLNDKLLISVIPNPNIKEVKLQAKTINGRNVNIFLQVDKIWWSINKGETPDIWKDTALMLKKSDFNTKSILIRIPSDLAKGKIGFGFENRELRTYSLRHNLDFISIPLIEYIDSEYEMNSLGRFKFYCEIIFQNERIKFSPCILENQIECRLCSFTTNNIAELFHHLKDIHFDRVFSFPNYDDIQKFLPPEFPKRIYQCIYCLAEQPVYIKSSSHNPTEEICKHIEREHPGQSISFRVENDINEIKNIINKEIPTYLKCKICGECFLEEELVGHLNTRIHLTYINHLL